MGEGIYSNHQLYGNVRCHCKEF